MDKNPDNKIEFDLDDSILDALEKAWMATLHRYTEAELIKIFPGAKSEIRKMITDRKNKRRGLKKALRNAMGKFKQDSRHSDKEKWFAWEVSWGMTVIPQIIKMGKEIRRLGYLISAGRLIKKGRKSWKSQLAIARRTPIVDVVEPTTKLKKSGSRYSGLCPLHNEKNPSFFVDPERNTFICFGCQQKGDVIKFIQLFHGLSFKNAVKFLNQH